MENYMETQLNQLHDAGSAARILDKFLFFLCGVVVIVLLPYLHIGVFYRLWVPDKPPVDRGKCDCSCFDTVFRGRYEYPVSSYKHVYFNATSNTLRIWIHTVIGILLAYEATRYLLDIIRRRKLRSAMFVLFLSSVYPHYYGWWGLFSYLNEDFYYQWNHQVFFTVTELISTFVVLHLCNIDNKIIPIKLLIIISLAIVHIIVGSLDQFLSALFLNKGWLFENVRNFALMIPDLLHFLVPFFELQICSSKHHIPFVDIFYKEELMLSGLAILLMSLFGRNM